MIKRNPLLTITWVLGALTLALVHASSASAFTYSEKKSSFDAMYVEMLNNPADLDLTIKYAELAVELGDYEAAISPLERVLLSHPDDAKLQLELGVLYYLLGAFDMSKIYLQDAQADAAGNAEIAAQAADYLSRM